MLNAQTARVSASPAYQSKRQTMTYNPMTEALDYVLWLTGDGIELDDAITKAAARLHVERGALALAYQSTI
jgi:hypothetical protein